MSEMPQEAVTAATRVLAEYMAYEDSRDLVLGVAESAARKALEAAAPAIRAPSGSASGYWRSRSTPLAPPDRLPLAPGQVVR